MPQKASVRRRRTAAPATWRLGEGAPPAGPFLALVPGAEAPLISLTLPATLKGPAREDVARRQAQDRLGPGLELRPARLGNTADSWTRAALADRAAVLRWRSALGGAAARCRGMVPDYLGLPVAPGLWSLRADREGVIARLGVQDGFAAEHALGVKMLALALTEARATNSLPRAVLLTGETGSAFADLFDGLTLVRDAADLPAGMEPALLAHGEASVDFARDPRADAQGLEARLRRVALPLALVVLGALGWAGAEALAIRQDRAEAVAIDRAVEAAVRRDILPSGPILDLRAQVTRAIAARRGAVTEATGPLPPLELLRAATPVLAAGAGSVEAVSLGVAGLSVELRLPDFRALDVLVQALAAEGIGARILRSSTDPEGGIGASLMLEATP